MIRAIVLQARITTPEKAAFTAAARAADSTLSDWVRTALRLAASKELGYTEYSKLSEEPKS